MVDGSRYIHYPKSDSCCYCCDDVHGCGVLKNDWLADATYEGIVDYDGEETFSWNKKGAQDNIYYETADADPTMRIPLYQNMGSGSSTQFIQEYDEKSFVAGIKDKSVFTLPDKCTKMKKCPINSVCTALRGEHAIEEFL